MRNICYIIAVDLKDFLKFCRKFVYLCTVNQNLVSRFIEITFFLEFVMSTIQIEFQQQVYIGNEKNIFWPKEAKKIPIGTK